MALVVKDRVKETTTSTGTGTINLAGAVSGFQTFVAGVGSTNTTYYAIEDANGTAWEVGLGTVTDASPDTLARTTILANSSGDTSAITLSSGTHTVFATYPAGKAVYLDADGATSFNLTDIPDFSFGGTNLTGTILVNESPGTSPRTGTLTGDNQYNVGIGYYALSSITDADTNVAIGHFANRLLTTGQDNVSIGQGAGEQMTTGDYNIQIGLRTHQYANDGKWNVAVGTEAMRGNSDGTSTTENYNNVAIGYQALYDIETGDSNTAVGDHAGEAVTTGSQNVLLGRYAGDDVTTESQMLYIGYQATASDGTFIKGDMANRHLAIGMADDHFVNSAGSPTLQVYPNDAADEAIFVKMPTSHSANLIQIQNSSGTDLFVVDSTGAISTGGATTLNNLTDVSYGGTNLTRTLLINNTPGSAPQHGTLGSDNYDNIAIGFDALKVATDTTRNIAIGSYTLTTATTADQNVSVGAYAGNDVTVGQYNVLVGDSAGRYIREGDSNVAIGRNALHGHATNTTNGEFNTAVGDQAGKAIETGAYNTFLGYYTGYSVVGGQGNIMIGKKAGSAETGNYMLYIAKDNESSNGSLIKGDMANKLLAIGKADVTLATEDATLQVYPNGTDDSAYFAQMPGSHTGDLIRIENSSGTNLFLVDKDGDVTITGSLTLDSVGVTAIQTSGESFSDDDTSLMTSAAIDDRINAASGSGEANEYSFKTISVSGQDDVVADTTTDTLTLAAGSNVTITTTAASDTVTIAATDTNTTYTAGDGLGLSGTEFSADLKANGGLVIESAEIAVDLSASSITGTLAIGDGGTGATSASAARTALGVDAAGTDNSTDVTLVTTSHDYLSISSQAITLGQIDIGDDTNLTAGTNISLSGDTLNVDDAFLVNDADDTTTGTITAGGFTTTGTWTFDEYTSGTVGITTVQDSGTTFNDNDTSLMTAAAIADKIEAYSYSTTTGTVTSVAISGTDGIDVDSGSPITSSGTITLGLSNIANSKLANSSITVSDGSSSTAVALGGTMTFSGTSNEVEVGESSGTVTIGLPDDVTIAGDLTVNGDTVTVNTATLSVEDPLIILASGNNAADSVDIGFYGLYDTSGSQDLYAGLFRDANDSGKFKLFKDLQAAPTTTVNTSGTGYAVATLVANIEGDVTGDVTGNADTVTTNANLTGHITSTGNAAVLGSFTVAQLSSALSDASISGNNNGDVTLAGSLDYITISGQEITRNAIDLAADVTGTLPVANGGTGASSLADKAVLITQDSGTDTVSAAVMDANGELLIGGTDGPAVATLTQGSNVTITNGNGSITIAATDTNTTYTGGTNLTLAGTTFNVDDAFLVNDADDTTTGTITAGGFTTAGTLTVDSVGITAIQTASESFADNDTSLMTSAAIDDRINSASGATTLNGLTDVEIATTSNLFMNNYGGTPAHGTLSSAVSNIAIGQDALKSITESDKNVSIGDDSLENITTGNGENIAVGFYAGNSVTTARYSVFAGGMAGRYAQNGSGLTYVGHYAGGGLNGGSDYTTSIGYQSHYQGTASQITKSVAIGAYAGYNATVRGVYVGYNSGVSNTVADRLLVGYDQKHILNGDFSNGRLAAGLCGTATNINLSTNAATLQLYTGATTTDMMLFGKQVASQTGELIKLVNSSDTELFTVDSDGTVSVGIWAGTDVAVAHGGTGASTAADARTNLGVDAAGTDNSTDVTLVTTSHDYLSISTQAITLGAIDLTADVTGTLPVANGGTGLTSIATLLNSNNNIFKTISVSGQDDVVADSATDTLTLAAGSNVTITTTAGTDTITIAATDTNTTYSAGTLLDLSSTTFNVDLSEASAAVMAEADEFIFLDNDDSSAAKRESLSDLLDTIAGTVGTTGLDRSGATLVVSDLHPVGVSGSANQLLTDDGDGTVTSQSNFTFTGSAATLTGTLTVGVDDTGHDVKFFGATSGSYMLWDEDADDLIVRVGDIIVQDASGNTEIAMDSSGTLVLGTNGDRQIRVDNESGTNTAGKHLDMRAGKSTGTGAGGSIKMYTGTTGGGSGSGSNAHAIALTLDENQTAQVEAGVYIKEAAAANADTAAYGQIWVKTATPNELYFTTDAGNDIQITSGTSLAGGGSIDGSGAAGYLAYWSDSDTLTYDNNQLFWDASSNELGVGTATPGSTLDISGSVGYKPFTIAEDVGEGDTSWDDIGANTYEIGSAVTYLVETGDTNRTIELPDPSSSIAGRTYTIKKIDSGTGTVTIQPYDAASAPAGGYIDGDNATVDDGTNILWVQYDTISATCAEGTTDDRYEWHIVQEKVHAHTAKIRMEGNSGNIADSTPTAIAYDTLDWAIGCGTTITGSDRKITINRKGKYSVKVQLRLNNTFDNGERADIQLFKNGTHINTGSTIYSPATNKYVYGWLDNSFELDVDDYLTVKINHWQGENAQIFNKYYDSSTTAYDPILVVEEIR